MLSKEAIDALRKQAQRDGMAYQRKLIEHIDALQAQLDKLQDDYTAQGLALKAAKAMQQAETERADANELDAKRYQFIRSWNVDIDSWGMVTTDSENYHPQTDDDFDEVIDIAIEEKQ